jgi:hypothetical protein
LALAHFLSWIDRNGVALVDVDRRVVGEYVVGFRNGIEDAGMSSVAAGARDLRWSDRPGASRRRALLRTGYVEFHVTGCMSRERLC